MGSHEVGDVLREHASRHSVPGAAIGILRDGVITTAYYGVADMGTGELVTPETRFAVGSLGKSMAATVAVRLADAGLWSLDDSVSAHVPELRGVRWAQRATLLDLLANRSRAPLSVETEFVGWPDDDDSVLSRFAAKIALGDPSPAVWSYTNAGWCVLGRAMEVLTGLAWENVVQTKLLDPLGMTQTTFTSWPSDVPRVSGHKVTADGSEPVPPWTPRNLGPAGTTPLSTVVDLLRLAGRHLDDRSLARLRTTAAETRIHGWLDTSVPYHPARVCSCGWRQRLTGRPDDYDYAQWQKHLAANRSAYQHIGPEEDGSHRDGPDGLTVTATCRCGWESPAVARANGAEFDRVFAMRNRHMKEMAEQEAAHGPGRPFDHVAVRSSGLPTAMWLLIAFGILACAACASLLAGIRGR